MWKGSCSAVAACIAAIGLIAVVPGAQADFVPQAGSPYALDNEPYSVNPGLFNGDALPDLAVIHGTSSTVRVFTQKPGNAGFAEPFPSFPAGSGANFAAVADFNGDGKQDLAISAFLAGQVKVMLGNGDGTFTNESNIPIGDQTGAIGGGDFNGDGKPDIVVAGWNTGNVSLYLRKGDNTGFISGGSFSSGVTNPRYIAVGDLDSTGGPDVAISGSASNNVGVLLHSGGVLAAAPGSPYAVGTTPQYVAIGLLDGDDLPDIASANYGSGNVTILRRKPAGGFEQTPTSPVAVGANPVGIVAADFRGTGLADLATANGSGTVTILENVGGAGFTRASDLTVTPAGSPYGIAAGRFNDGDTALDLAVTSLSSSPNYLSIFLNRRPPKAATNEASNVAQTSATLNGTVNPGGFDSDAYFEYGTSTDYGSRAPVGGEIPTGSDRADHPVSRNIDGLTPGTTYHYRIVAKNPSGSTPGGDRSFTTTSAGGPPPSAVDGPPQASISAPSEIATGTPTTVSAVGSTPAAGLRYAFDLDGSGKFATDMKNSAEVQTTFTATGDVVVGVRVTDTQGRTDTVRRTVHVTAPPVYTLTTTPAAPTPGQRVTFKVRELLPSDGLGVADKAVKLDRQSLATMTFGDDKPVSGLLRGLDVRGKAVSATGTFTHVFDDPGRFRLRVNVDDGKGNLQGVDLGFTVGGKANAGYTPVIATPTTTVEQGYCATFENGTSGQLSVDEVGSVQKRDVNPANQVINVKPAKPGDIVFGGHPNWGEVLVSPTQFATSSVFKVGSPGAGLQFNVDKLNIGALNINGRRGFRQGEVTTTTTGTEACERFKALETAAANVAKPQSDPKWQKISECPGGLKSTTYSYDKKLESDLVTQDTVTTRHTFFAANRWNFGDGTTSGPEAYLPSYQAYHAYDRPGTFNVTLTTSFPKNLKTQVADWNANCTSKPLNASNNDSRFETKTASVKLRVLARYDRVRSRGLWLTTGTSGGFRQTDFDDVYQTSSAIYINTRRFDNGYNPKTQVFDYSSDAGGADGVLVVNPVDQPLRLNAKTGEITGAANIFWQNSRQTLALGGMPLKLAGVPGLIIPEATNGNEYDFGVFNDPPARINAGTGGAPPKGAAWHVNAAHPVLRRDAGGKLELNVHVPPPMGPDGYGGDITIFRDVRSTGRAKLRAGILDNVDITIPKFEIVPDVVSFDGGKLSHHVADTPPWQATGGLTVFGKKVSMSPDSKKPNCPVTGGLGFQENGELYNAGAVLDGLVIPIPNPPAPNPITALANPALEFRPPTDTRPLLLFGCLTMQDYPEAKAFKVVGCAGFLMAGTGKSIPPGEKLKFCPDQYGNEDFALTERNSKADPAKPGNRIVKGFVVRVSGGLLLGPIDLPVANAYLEVQSSPPGVQAAGHVKLKIIPEDHLKLEGTIFGYFYGTDDWAVGGSGGVTQDIICLPVAGCPSISGALLVSSSGLGFCVSVWPATFGGTVNIKTGKITPFIFSCDENDLKESLGVTRALPRSEDYLLRASDPLRAIGAGQSAPVELGGGAGAAIVVNGQGAPPVVQVKDPSGKVVLDDTGAPSQGLDFTPPKVANDPTTGQPITPTGQMPQGLFHNASQYHDDKIDLRNATVIRLRAPKKGKWTIVAKNGSAPITAIKSIDYAGDPSIKGGVVAATSGAAKKAGKKLLTLKGLRVPKGTTLEISEQGKIGGGKVTKVRGTGAPINRQVPFTPAPGPSETRKLVAVITRNGIPRQRYIIGSYRSPAPKKAGRVKGLKTKLRGSKLTVSWKPATNATRYIVTVALARGLKVRQTVKGRSLVLTEPLARNGATVTVLPVTAGWDAGVKASKRLAPLKVKRPKRFRL